MNLRAAAEHRPESRLSRAAEGLALPRPSGALPVNRPLTPSLSPNGERVPEGRVRGAARFVGPRCVQNWRSKLTINLAPAGLRDLARILSQRSNDMRHNQLRIMFVLLALLCGADDIRAQGTAFTYQGRLQSGGNPAN